MVLVELDNVAIWWVRQEILPGVTFKEGGGGREALLLYQPSYILSTHLMHFETECPFSAIYCMLCRAEQSHHLCCMHF
jgi:hypothetical protein